MENKKITPKDHVDTLVRTVKFACALAELDHPDCGKAIVEGLIDELEKMAGRKKPCAGEGGCRTNDKTEETCGEPRDMDFGAAIRLLKEGHCVARKGWNGKGQYVELASGISYIGSTGQVVNADHQAIGNKALAFVGTSGVQLGWLASQADMLAEDWCAVR